MTAGSLPFDAVIPAWNGRLVILASLQSLQSAAPTSIIVVDNGSTDGTPEFVERAGLRVRLERFPENRGFAVACNEGIRQTSAPYVLLLNQDAVVDAAGIRALRAFLHTHPQCAAAGGRMENPDGTLQPSMGPRPHPLRVALDRVPLLRAALPAHAYRNPRAYARPRQPAWLTGACLLLHRAALNDVGFFDESYFMYAEDLEWCARARKRGWALQYLPVRTAVHRDEGRRPDRAPAKARWMREGLLRYFETHGTPGETRLFRVLLAVERSLCRKRVILNAVKDPIHDLGT